MPLRLVMMGTGRFALPAFRSLYETEHEIAGLFTRPDRTGPGHHRHRNLVKQLAGEHGTPVFQPEDINPPEAVDDLRRLQPDVCIVAAYGQILSSEVIGVPRLGVVNLHASLLPKYRGAAPVAHAILNGETETGVTIFRIEPQLDAGPILAVARTEIRPGETAGELEERLADLAAPLTGRVVEAFAAGNIEETSQDSRQATRAPRLTKQDGLIDWTQPAERIECHVRAMQPWPKPFTFLHQGDREPVRLILLDVEPVETATESETPPGTVVEASSRHLIVQTGRGGLSVRRLQPEGKRAMDVTEFLQGHPVHADDRLGATPRRA